MQGSIIDLIRVSFLNSIAIFILWRDTLNIKYANVMLGVQIKTYLIKGLLLQIATNSTLATLLNLSWP